MGVVRVLVVAAVVAAALVAPSQATAAAGGLTFTASSRTPTVGQVVTLSGTVRSTTRPRQVRLQRWTGRSWSTLRTTTTSRRGAFSFRHAVGAPASLRATAPAVRQAGRRLPTRTSSTLRLRPVAPAPAPAATPAPAGSPAVTPSPTPSPSPTPDPEPTTDPQPVPVEVLPRVDVTTTTGEPITSREVYQTATMTIDPRGSTLAASTTPMRIRVRGNVTSWVSIKLPYKIKTDKKASLLGMPASRNWALLANFYDRSMLRNQLAFEISRRIGLPWTPRTQHVELWVDGGYRGLYQLAENVEAEPDRVVVPEGGHLLEADSYADDSTPSFRTPRGIQIFLKGDETEAERDVVASQVAAFEDALYGDGFTGPGGWASHADVGSFVDWYIVNELTKNIDASLRNSVWMTIDAQGRLSMGPVWDFDFSAGNRSNWQTDLPTGWFLRTSWFDPTWPQSAPTQVNSPEAGPGGHWFVRLFDDPAFERRVRERWNEVSDDLATLPGYVRSQAEKVAPAAARNFAEGSNGAGLPIGPTFLDPEPDHVFAGSWDGEVDLLATWIRYRRSWIDQQLDD